MESRINTSNIKDFISKPKKERKKYTHKKEYIEKKDQELKDRLVAQLKSEDPVPFLTEENLVRIHRLPGETYKLIPDTYRYYVSDKGNALKIIYDKPTDTFLERPLHLLRNRNKTGKYYISINVHLKNGERICCRLSRAIAQAFIDPNFPLLFDKNNNLIADHIDNNSENNNLSNLRICNQAQNIHYAIFEQGKVVGKPMKACYAYNIDSKELREYSSTSELVEDIFGKSNNGWFYCYNKNKFITDTGWAVGYDPEELKTRVRKEKYRGGRKKRV